jgi:hypothetical protein
MRDRNWVPSGFPGSSPSWPSVRPEVARFIYAYSYGGAGLANLVTKALAGFEP